MAAAEAAFLRLHSVVLEGGVGVEDVAGVVGMAEVAGGGGCGMGVAEEGVGGGGEAGTFSFSQLPSPSCPLPQEVKGGG